MPENVLILADQRNANPPRTPRGTDGSVVAHGATAPGGVRVAAIDESAQAGREADAYFIAFGDITNRALIEAAAQSGRATLLDTTGATLKEVVRACGWHQLAFRTVLPFPVRPSPLPGGARLCLLHGAMHGAPPNLRALRVMHEHTNVAIGLAGSADALVCGLAVALGAAVLLCPGEGLEALAREVRRCEAALGSPQKAPDSAELGPANAARKRIVAARDVAQGHVVEAADIAFAHPGPAQGQFAPYQQDSVIGRPAKADLKFGHVFHSDDLGGEAPAEAPWFAPRPPSSPPME